MNHCDDSLYPYRSTKTNITIDLFERGSKCCNSIIMPFGGTIANPDSIGSGSAYSVAQPDVTLTTLENGCDLIGLRL